MPEPYAGPSMPVPIFPNSAMTYDFTLILALEGEEGDLDLLERLLAPFEGDATPGIRPGVAYAAFSVEAPSMEIAIRDAVTYLENNGVKVLRVEIERDEVPA